MGLIVASDQAGLWEILEVICDCWFRHDAFTYDRKQRRVTVALNHPERKRSRFFGWRYDTPGDRPAGTLIFDGVEGFEVVDEADAGWYNFGSILTEPRDGGVSVTLYGGIPIQLQMACPRVAVRFEPASS